jgi:hypothetical protein
LIVVPPPNVFLRILSASGHYRFMNWKHISDHDLERYYLGMVTDDNELAALEEHILACRLCAERADEAQDFVDAIRAAAILIDLE